ncbi:hypothetical protein BU16DRAFT_46402 [Lophium mytilinum]|uniref:Ig-like domain-containing protein n=1 Tax=Lophium mytilinum TaxID=390894 RepID=A0A6A6QRE2_9PEZI|nr:hypothetical protein BU16DRAFT_46402 [Lophium mytilinum]
MLRASFLAHLGFFKSVYLHMLFTCFSPLSTHSQESLDQGPSTSRRLPISALAQSRICLCLTTARFRGFRCTKQPCSPAIWVRERRRVISGKEARVESEAMCR